MRYCGGPVPAVEYRPREKLNSAEGIILTPHQPWHVFIVRFHVYTTPGRVIIGDSQRMPFPAVEDGD